MNNRRPSVSEMSQPGLPQNHDQAPAYVAPAEFGNFDAVFPPLNAAAPVPAIVVAAGNDAVIDVAHDQQFADMLTMVALEKKLTAKIQADKRFEAKKGIYFSVLGMIFAIAGVIHTVTTRNEEGNFDWSGEEATENNLYFVYLLAAINLFVLTMVYVNTNYGLWKVEGVLNDAELMDLDLFTNLDGKASAIDAVKALNTQLTNHSIRAHGALETIYLNGIMHKLQKTLSPNTTAPLPLLAIATGFAISAIVQYNDNGPTNQFWSLVFIATSELDLAAFSYFAKHYKTRSVSSNLNTDQLTLAKKITRDNEIGRKETIKAMFQFKKAIAAPLTPSTLRALSFFHTQERQRHPIVVAPGEVEMQLRRG